MSVCGLPRRGRQHHKLGRPFYVPHTVSLAGHPGAGQRDPGARISFVVTVIVFSSGQMHLIGAFAARALALPLLSGNLVIALSGAVANNFDIDAQPPPKQRNGNSFGCNSSASPEQTGVRDFTSGDSNPAASVSRAQLFLCKGAGGGGHRKPSVSRSVEVETEADFKLWKLVQITCPPGRESKMVTNGNCNLGWIPSCD